MSVIEKLLSKRKQVRQFSEDKIPNLEDVNRKSGVAKSKRFSDDTRKLIKQKNGIDTFFGSVHINDITTGMMRK